MAQTVKLLERLTRFRGGAEPAGKRFRLSPLRVEELNLLFEKFPWDAILKGTGVGSSYGGFASWSFIAGHSLPYLVRIPSERALARALREKEVLQLICGHSGRRADDVVTPTRAMLWHFRRRHGSAFQEALVRTLVTLFLRGKESEIDVPFTAQASPTDSPQGKIVKSVLEMQDRSICVTVQFTALDLFEDDDSQFDLGFEARHNRVVSKDTDAHQRQLPVGLFADVSLPALVDMRGTGVCRMVWLLPPLWGYRNLQSKDEVAELGPSHRTREYTACSVVIERWQDGKPEILMAKRLRGYGRGSFALPGGKKKANESIRDCATREVREETGLTVSQCTPVSLHNTTEPGQPPVQSIGVVAQRYEGQPRRKEEHNNGPWTWFPIDKLPRKIFRPSSLVLEAYFGGERRPSWVEIEDAPTLFELVEQ